MNRRVPEPPARTSLWIVGALLAFAVIAFVAFLSLAQVASPGPGERIMARTVAVLTEIDTSIVEIEESLAESAGEAGQDPVPVPDFPVPVEVPRELALSGDTGSLREAILTQSGERMYDDGVSVWDDTDPDAQQTIADNSSAGGTRAALVVVGGTPRLIFLALAAISLVVAAGLAVALTFQMHALERLVALGASLLAGGAPGLVVVFFMRFVPSLATGDDAFSEGLSNIAEDAVSVALRNYLIVTVLGAAFLVVGLGAGWLESRGGSSKEPTYDTNF